MPDFKLRNYHGIEGFFVTAKPVGSDTKIVVFGVTSHRMPVVIRRQKPSQTCDL
jgi:hypothetical protein